MDGEHKPSYIVAIIVCCVTFCVTMVFNGLAGASPEGLGRLDSNQHVRVCQPIHTHTNP